MDQRFQVKLIAPIRILFQEHKKMEKMKANVFRGAGKFQIEEAEKPRAGANGAVMMMVAVKPCS